MGGAEPRGDRGGAPEGRLLSRLTPTRPHAGQPVETGGHPLGRGRAVMIMVHGRGAGPRNILDLVPALVHPDFTYLAPAAANGTWYPLSFMAEIERNEPGMTSGISVIHGLIDDAIAKGIPTERIMLLGFSQGACLASTAALRRPARYGGVIGYCGGLIGPPGTRWEVSGSFDGMPVFLGCSDRDAHVPRERVDETAAQFERMGAAVNERIYPGMGHLVNEDEIAFTRDLMHQAGYPGVVR
ncbi:MAG: dienelactone hydrolase family protein [Gemmatimonadetes bacterium]|nr:dienelactone hydrolase family protein [Gemmatimonadota bacterium]